MRCEKIYGVDLSKEITPIIVRDALVRCFSEAHKEVLKKECENGQVDMSSEKIEKLCNMNAELFVKKCFAEVGADFEDPKKNDFIRVMDKLADFSESFRSQEVIKRHYEEMMILVNKL